MKYSILYIFIILTSSIFAQRSPELFEKNRFEAQIRRDTTALDNLLSADLLYVHSNALVETRLIFTELLTWVEEQHKNNLSKEAIGVALRYAAHQLPQLEVHRMVACKLITT